MKGLVFLLFLVTNLKAQIIVSSFESEGMDTITLHKEYGQFKKLPNGFERQALIALSYFPELKGTSIEFELKEDIIPLATMPSVWSIFKKPSKRTYYVTISLKSNKLLTPILLKNLGTDAQLGVLGHELSHVSDFQSYYFWKFIFHAIKYTFFPLYGDRFEFNTDRICINHGLGNQLKAWSSEVRQKLDMRAFKKEYNIDERKERYMFPSTIDSIMAIHPLYKIH